MEYTLGKSDRVVDHHEVEELLDKVDWFFTYLGDVGCDSVEQVQTLQDELYEVRDSENYQKYENGEINDDGNDLTDDELYDEE